MQKVHLLLLSTETCLHFDLLDFLLLSPCCFLLIGGQGDETLKVLCHLFLGLNAVFFFVLSPALKLCLLLLLTPDLILHVQMT